MKRTSKSIVFGVGAVALASLAALAAHSLGSEPVDGSAATPTTTQGAAADAERAEGAERGGLVLPQRRWTSGSTFVYAIQTARSVGLRGGARGQDMEWGLTGHLTIAVVGPAEDGSRLRFSLQPSADTVAKARALGVAPEALMAAFYAVTDRAGHWTSFAFVRGTKADARGILKGLATSLQLVVPTRAATSWRTVEQDASGEYEAAYRVVGSNIHKSKDHFLRARGAKGLQPVVDPATYQVVSSIDLTLADSGWPATLSEQETLDIDAGGVRASARNSTAAELVSSDPLPDLASLVEREEANLELEPEVDLQAYASSKERADRGLVGDATFASLTDDLRSGQGSVRNAALGRLGALIRLEPGTADQAVKAILSGDLDDGTRKRMIGALGSAGSEEAQEALATVLDAQSAPTTTRREAAAVLGMSDEPTESTKDALLAASKSDDGDLSATSTLGVGNLVKRMNETGSADTTDAIAMLIARLEAAQDDTERGLCLDALGNTGDTRALPAIVGYLTYPEIGVQATAVSALRFMNAEAADQAIGAALQHAHPTLRRAAAGTLSYRMLTPVRPVVEIALKTDGDTTTRMSLVTAMIVRKKYEPVTDLLQWSAENDPAEEVRNAAASAL